MNSSVFGNLLTVQRDEDLRRSLIPIGGDARTRQFTKFIKFGDDPSVNRTASMLSQPQPVSHSPVFHSLQQPNSKKELRGTQLLARYRDKSLFVQQMEKPLRLRFVQSWSGVLGFILRQKQKQERTFRRDSGALLAWNVLVLLSYLWNIFQVPIALFFTEVVYQSETQNPWGLAISWLFIALMLVNTLLVAPNTQFEKRGYVISSRQEIMSNYLGFACGVDVLGLLIVITYYASGLPQLIYLKPIFYLNISTVLRLDSLVLGYLELKLYALAFYRLLRLEVFIVFIVFWLSSIFFAIDYYFYRYGPYQGTANWLTYEPATMAYPIDGSASFPINLIQSYPWYIWLNYAAYWCLQTISTVGYGDITPRNPPSVVFTSFTILIAMFFFVFFINSIIEIIDEMTSAEEKQRKANVKQFKEYYNESQRKMREIAVKFGFSQQVVERNQKIAEDTADNIRSYLYEMDLNNLLDDDNNVQTLVYGNLTPELRQELFLNYRQLFFKKILLFGQIAKTSPKFIDVYEELIYKIKQVPYGSQEVVYLNRQNDSNSLYFLLKGSLILKYPLSSYTKLISDGSQQPKDDFFQNFGVQEFITQQWRHHLALTLTYCKIQTLHYADFLSVIKKYPQFYNKYCEIRDCVQVELMNMYTGEECFECGSKRHHLLICDKCLFNFPKAIRSAIANNGLKIRREKAPAVHQRAPQFLRDPLTAKKVLFKGAPKQEPKLETISNCNEYFSKRNLTNEVFSLSAVGL